MITPDHLPSEATLWHVSERGKFLLYSWKRLHKGKGTLTCKVRAELMQTAANVFTRKSLLPPLFTARSVLSQRPALCP